MDLHILLSSFFSSSDKQNSTNSRASLDMPTSNASCETNGNHSVPSISEKVLREATTDKDVYEKETNNVSDVEVASSWAYQTKLFPKLFATVIYIVLLFVSFGTIFTQLMIFAKDRMGRRIIEI